jgi:hypothetical protein
MISRSPFRPVLSPPMVCQAPLNQVESNLRIFQPEAVASSRLAARLPSIPVERGLAAGGGAVLLQPVQV